MVKEFGEQMRTKEFSLWDCHRLHRKDSGLCNDQSSGSGAIVKDVPNVDGGSVCNR